jgi:hypothetical protein
MNGRRKQKSSVLMIAIALTLILGAIAITEVPAQTIKLLTAVERYISQQLTVDS